jgi:hypothetical protein
VGCAGAHGSAALGRLITSRGLFFVTGEDLSAPFCLGQSPQGGRSSLPYLSEIDPIRAYAPPIFGNGEKEWTRSEVPLVARKRPPAWMPVVDD